jgi:hypothetical protein
MAGDKNKASGKTPGGSTSASAGSGVGSGDAGVKARAATKPPKNGVEWFRWFCWEHSLSIASITIVIVWIVLYIRSDPNTHWGSFFGNAIADWSGVVVTVLGTKFFYEKGSAESKSLPKRLLAPLPEWFREHSLTIFLAITGIGWVVLFAKMNAQGKWGQVVGNIVSEWTQCIGLVILTKKLIEKHSKESQK